MMTIVRKGSRQRWLIQKKVLRKPIGEHRTFDDFFDPDLAFSGNFNVIEPVKRKRALARQQPPDVERASDALDLELQAWDRASDDALSIADSCE